MKKQSVAIIAVVALVLAVAVGYALFSETLTINGTATAQGTFDMEFTTATVSNEVGSTGTTAVIADDKNSLTITVPKLEYPGAYAEIAVTVTNKGSIPAKLDSIEETGLTTDASVKVSYTGLNELKGQVVNQNETQTFNVKVMWDAASNASSENVTFTIKLNYSQITASTSA